ncbi:type-1 angiotensin II receptor-like isoform X2 [Watersipora subatra]|uniref:type-1 angiotensin II receptor-like isoform X2 n=1 Tax=Watersipora subatra TaxID=2589382 RepID=UPI00355B2F9B
MATTDYANISLQVEVLRKGISCNVSYAPCALSRDLWIYTSPFVLLLGTIGNILIIILMSAKKLRKTSFGLYLIAIACMDLIFIWVGLTRHFIKNAFNEDIRYLHVTICWLQRFFVYGSSDASVWLLTAVTIERTIAIYSPTRYMKVNTLFKTKIYIGIIIFIQFTWNAHLFFTRGTVQYELDGRLVEDRCGYANEKAKIYYENNIQTLLAMLDYSMIPFVAMLGMNIAIFVRLHKRDKMYNKCTSVHNKTVAATKQHKTKSSHVSSKTLMLLPVTMFFLVTTLPHLVFTGIEQAKKTEDLERAKMELADYFVSLLGYLNHSLNFFLYCLTGKMLRTRCRKLLTRCCSSKENDSYIDHTYNKTITSHTRKDNSSPKPVFV